MANDDYEYGMLHSDIVKTGYISFFDENGDVQTEKIEYFDVDGEAIFEGCIVLGTVEEMEERRKLLKDPYLIDAKSLTVKHASSLWSKGYVPYTIASNLPNTGRVKDAIKHWEQKTDIKFFELSLIHI